MRSEVQRGKTCTNGGFAICPKASVILRVGNIRVYRTILTGSLRPGVIPGALMAAHFHVVVLAVLPFFRPGIFLQYLAETMLTGPNIRPVIDKLHGIDGVGAVCITLHGNFQRPELGQVCKIITACLGRCGGRTGQTLAVIGQLTNGCRGGRKQWNFNAMNAFIVQDCTKPAHQKRLACCRFIRTVRNCLFPAQMPPLREQGIHLLNASCIEHKVVIVCINQPGIARADNGRHNMLFLADSKGAEAPCHVLAGFVQDNRFCDFSHR